MLSVDQNQCRPQPAISRNGCKSHQDGGPKGRQVRLWRPPPSRRRT
jgi:hypothetical protein